MKSSFFYVGAVKAVAAVVLAAAFFGADGAEKLPVRVRAERESALYRAGEEIVFRVRALDENGSPVAGKKLDWTLSGDGGLLKKGTVTPGTDGEKITVTWDKPGFVLLEVVSPAENGKRPRPVHAGAGVDVEKIRCGAMPPPDFDAFWDAQLKELRSRPFKSKLTELKPSPHPGVRIYDVRLDDGTLGVTGYLVIPEKAVKGGHPAELLFNGAGSIGASWKSAAPRAARYNAIVFDMSVQDVPNGLDDAGRRALRKSPRIAGYMYRGVESPETYPIREVFLRVARSIDFVKSLPEWDGRTLVTFGGSLGGAQSIFAAYAEPQVCLCVANAPALADHFGAEAGHAAGWPDMFRTLAKEPEKLAKARKTMRYFDLVNFVRRVRCPVRLSVGFIDRICPPATAYALYHAIPGEKSIARVVTGKHGLADDPRERNVFARNIDYVDEILLPAKRMKK